MLRARTWLIGSVAGLANTALYLAFASNVGWRELAASIISGGIAATAAFVAAAAGKVHLHFRAQDVFQAWRIPWLAIHGTIQVLHGLINELFARKGSASCLVAAPFNVGRNNDPVDAARRALAITYTTATPNCIVLGVVENPPLLLYHQIVPAGLPSITRKLGALP